MYRSTLLLAGALLLITTCAFFGGCVVQDTRNDDSRTIPVPVENASDIKPNSSPSQEIVLDSLNNSEFNDLGISFTYPALLTAVYTPDRNYSLVDGKLSLPEARSRSVSFVDPSTRRTVAGIDWISLTMTATNRKHLEDVLDNQVLYPGISRIIEGKQVAERKQTKEAGRDVLFYEVWEYGNESKKQGMHYFYVNITSGRTALLHHVFGVVSDSDPHDLSPAEWQNLRKSFEFADPKYGESNNPG
jgi:hypothetical protein